MIINVDRKNRTINLSVKQKDLADENEAMAEQVKAALVSGALKPEDIAALFGKLAAK